MNFFISYAWKAPEFFFSWILFVVFSICCHEYMHARVALMEGDDTAAREGHLTLNPMKQMGIFSLFMLAMIGISWGQVPVNPAKFRHKYSDLKISLAGPFTNLFLALVFALSIVLLSKFFIDWHKTNMLIRMLYNGAVLNIVLFIFNILPAPGFDGWSLVRTFADVRMIQNSELLKGASLLFLILAITFMDYIYRFAEIVILKFLSFF